MGPPYCRQTRCRLWPDGFIDDGISIINDGRHSQHKVHGNFSGIAIINNSLIPLFLFCFYNICSLSEKTQTMKIFIQALLMYLS